MADGGSPAPVVDEQSIFEAWSTGFHYGVTLEAVAVAHIATANEALELCRVTGGARRAIWQQAEYEAACDYPDLSPLTQKAVAARRIALLLARRARRDVW